MRSLKQSFSYFTLLAVFSSSLLLFACGGQNDSTDQNDDVRADAKQEPVDIPSLQAKLDEKKASFEQTAPPEKIAEYQKAIDDLEASGILDSMLNVGDTAPMFALPSHTGDTVSLEAILENGPVVLSWYRGGWCPYCNLQLTALNDALGHIEESGATLIAISPEIPDSAASTVSQAGLKFVAVSDLGNKVADRFNIVFELPDNIVEAYKNFFDMAEYNGDDSWTLPLAATYVIDTDGTITYAFASADYRVRAEPAEVVNEVKKLTNPGT